MLHYTHTHTHADTRAHARTHTSPRRVFSILPFTSRAKSASSSMSRWAVMIGVLHTGQENEPTSSSNFCWRMWMFGHVRHFHNSDGRAEQRVVRPNWQPFMPPAGGPPLSLRRPSLSTASPTNNKWDEQVLSFRTWCSSRRWWFLWCAALPGWCSWRPRRQSGRFSVSSECRVLRCSVRKEPRPPSQAPSELCRMFN